MRKMLLFFMLVILIVVMAIPTFASSVLDNYDLPSPPDLFLSKDYRYLGMKDDNYVIMAASGSCVQYQSPGVFYQDGRKLWIWTLTDGVWKVTDGDRLGYCQVISYIDTLIWCSHDVVYENDESLIFLYGSDFSFCDGSSCPSRDINKDNICDDCGYEFAVPRDYSPFTVKKFMNHIGQILTSAVSWVSDVGAAILAQPLLLAFTALPLCGLGIAVFRRLKETV